MAMDVIKNVLPTPQSAVVEEVSVTGDPIASPLGQVSWALYEWARNPYIILVTIFLFAPYFTTVVVGDPIRGQAIWGQIAGYGGLAVALFAPFLGAIADVGGRRKPWLFLFTVLLSISAMSLWWARPGLGDWQIAGIGLLVAIANASFEFSSTFHGAMLPSIAPHGRVGKLSGLGVALGSLSGLLVLIGVTMTMVLPGSVDWWFVPSHPLFGIGSLSYEVPRLCGPIAGAWLLLFSIPFFAFTPDRVGRNTALFRAIADGVRSVIRTLRKMRDHRNVATYLVARAAYNDGITGSITFGGIYAAGTFGWPPLTMTVFGIVLSLFGTMGGLLGGWLADRFGAKRAIILCLVATGLTSLLSLSIGPDRIFWFIQIAPHANPANSLPFFSTWPEIIYLLIVCASVPFVTATYACSRTMLVRIAPPEKMTEFFGLMSLSGTSTAFLVPLGIGLVTAWTHSQRGGMLVVILFLGVGAFLITYVDENRPIVSK